MSHDIIGIGVLAENGGKFFVLATETKINVDWLKMGQIDPNKKAMTNF